MGGSIHIFREFLNPSSHCPALSNGAVFELVMKTLTQLCVPASFGTLENISVLTWLCIDYIQNKNKVTRTLKYCKKVALIQVCIYTHRHLYKMYIYETHEMWNSVHIVLHKILFGGKKKKSSAAKNTHGNFWPGISKAILSSASQSSQSLTKIAPLVTFSSVHLEGKYSSCFQLPQEARDEPAGPCGVVVAHSFHQSLTWLFGRYRMMGYADPCPQSLSMTASSSESQVFAHEVAKHKVPVFPLPDVWGHKYHLPCCLLVCVSPTCGNRC